MSKMADELYECLTRLFPFENITAEYYINYKNTRLFFDFYIRNMNLLFEVQGEQHYKFVKHFHGTKEKFYGQRRRDNLKLEYLELEENSLTLVYFYDKIDKITDELVLQRISEALDE